MGPLPAANAVVARGSLIACAWGSGKSKDGSQEALARGADDERAAPGSERRPGRAVSPGCGPSSSRTLCPGRREGSPPSGPGPRPSSSRSTRKSYTSSTTSPYEGALHGPGRPGMRISITRALGVADDGDHLRVHAQRRDVVDHEGPGRECLGRYRGLAGVDGDTAGSSGARALTTGSTRSSSAPRHRVGAGPARLPSDLDEVGILLYHVQSGGDGCLDSP